MTSEWASFSLNNFSLTTLLWFLLWATFPSSSLDNFFELPLRSALTLRCSFLQDTSFPFFSHSSQAFTLAKLQHCSLVMLVSSRSRHIIPRISLWMRCTYLEKSSSPSVSRSFLGFQWFVQSLVKSSSPSSLVFIFPTSKLLLQWGVCGCLGKTERSLKSVVHFLTAFLMPAHLETQTFACSSPGDRATKHATQHFVHFLPFTRPFHAVLSHKAS